jgi:acyl transferase domain-containing protein
MAGAVASLHTVAATLRHSAPQVPWISSQTGSRLTEREATDPTYWARQVVAPVQWAAAVASAAAQAGAPAVWLELGPGHTLAHLVRGATMPVATITPLDGDDAGASLARALGAVWAAGITPDWPAVHAPSRPRRVPLPTYPFQRQRYWLEAASADDQELIKRDDPASWLYLPCWKQTPVAAPQAPVGPCVLVARDDAFGRSLQAELSARQCRVVSVDATAESPVLESVIRQALQEATAVHVVHALSVHGPDADAGATALDSTLFSVIALVQALTPHDRVEIRLSVVTTGTHLVHGDEELDPVGATLRGLCAVVPLEHPRIATALVDIDRAAAGTPGAIARLADEILAQPSDTVVAHRGSRRWVQTYEPIAARARARRAIVSGATYLITGGAGRIGFAIARHVQQAGARVILMSRHASRHDAAAVGLVADRVRLVDADIADERATAAALAAAEADLGPIRGVIHAAAATAATDFPLLQDLDADVCRRHLRPKLDGTLALARVLGDRALDFCLLMSSISSRLGGVGFGAYAAANAFMDAFAERQAARGNAAWISAGWDGWRFDASNPRDAAPLAMTAAEGIAALEAVLAASDGGSVVVSTAHLPLRLASLRPHPATATAESDALRFPRPLVSSEFAEPRTDVERRIAAAWQSALGIDRVGRHDNFVELGGHSLLGVQLMASLSTSLGVRLSQRDLWETPTVAGLAAKVEGTGSGVHETVNRQVLEALETIHNLSDEEIERLLSE